MQGRSPERRFTFMVVPEEGRGQVRQVTLSLTELRRWLMAAVAVGALAVLGVLMLATAVPRGLVVRGIMDENVAMKASLQQIEVELDQVEDALRRLRLYDAQLRSNPANADPVEERDETPDAPMDLPVEPPEVAPDAPGQGGEELDLELEDGSDGEEQSAALRPGEALALRVADRLRRTVAVLEHTLPLVAALAEAAEGDFAQDGSLPSLWPVQGVLSSGFGWRRSPFSKRWKFHTGIDIAADRGDWVLAPAPGTVVKAQYAGGYGNLLEIDHGNEVHSRLAHNSTLHVSVGDTVKAGQKVATVGSTGHSTGPHCHLEILIDGEQVDPLLLLP